ncbi:hypothetical protein BC830DRAFT_1068611 [Chytriomyces sp. MP71]|nr:hypothetical protein BC830DRAFT_1068611 [Chytriomyces sp. MP71]
MSLVPLWVSSHAQISSKTGRGLMATRRIEAGDAIVRIASTFLITVATAADVLRNEAVNSLNEHCALALFMAKMRFASVQERGMWHAYVDITPRDFDTCAANLPVELLALLTPEVRLLAQRQVAKMESDYVEASAVISVSKDDFKWGWYSVNTRCITLSTSMGSNSTKSVPHNPGVRKEPSIALAPFLDLLNHTTNAKIHADFNPANNAFEIIALEPVERGSECFIAYGPHDNAFLLAEYGFVVREAEVDAKLGGDWVHNAYDHVIVDREVLGVAIPGERKGFRELALKELGDAGLLGDYALQMHQDSYRVMNALRLFACSFASPQNFKSDLIRWRMVTQGQLEAVSDENEQAARVFLREICSDLLTQTNNALHAIEAWRLQESKVVEEESTSPSGLSDLKAMFCTTVYESRFNILTWNLSQ